MSDLSAQLAKYGLIGVINTLITFIIIATLTYIGINPFACNLIGFAAGLLNSYIMNSKITFKKSFENRQAARFIIGFLISYAINLIVLSYAVTLADFNALLPQLIAMITYNISFFIIMKLWVFGRE